MNLSARIHRSSVLSLCLVGLAAAIAFPSVASAQEWDGGAGTLDWNTATNWDPDSVPNGIGATATLDTILVYQVTQDTVIGTINVTTLPNSSPNIGIVAYNGTAGATGNDLTFDVVSGNAQLNFSNTSSAGRIFLNTNATNDADPSRFVFNDSLDVNATINPNNVRRLFIQGDANSWVGNGNSINLNARGLSLQMEQSNPNTMTGFTLNLRGGRNDVVVADVNDDSDAVLYLRSSQGGANMIAQLGNNDGAQKIHLDSSGAISLGWNIQLYGNQGVNISKEANGTTSLTGVISGSESTALNIFNTGTGTFTIGGTAANTYNGVTTVDFGGTGTLALAKAGAIGDDLVITDLNILDINSLGALKDGLDLTLNDTSTIIQTGGFALTLNSWKINGFALAAGQYSSASGVINGYDFGTQFTEGAIWTVVPEPGTGLALTLGGLGLLLRRRRN